MLVVEKAFDMSRICGDEEGGKKGPMGHETKSSGGQGIYSSIGERKTNTVGKVFMQPANAFDFFKLI